MTFKCFRAIVKGNEVYAIKSGWGLIDAAMATQYLITKYGVEIVLNFGVTGALDPSLKVSDLFYVSKCINFDFDTSSIDDVVKHQYGDMEDEFVPLDSGLIDLVKSIYPEIKEAIQKLSDQFANEGRVLIRPSGTEPLVRVMIEGKDQEQIDKEARVLADLIEKVMA